MCIGVSVFSALILSVYYTIDAATGAYDEAQSRAWVDSQAHKTLDFAARQFLDAGAGEFVPADPLGESDISYRRPVSYLGGVLNFGPLMGFQLELEDQEIDDGIDNNGNGLVDERVLVWLQDVGPNQTRSVRSHYVRELLEGELPNGVDDNGNGLADEPGFHVALQGDVLTVRLTIERFDADNRLLTKTVETSVNIRN